MEPDMKSLVRELEEGRISRREFIRRAVLMGVALPIAQKLAAFGQAPVFGAQAYRFGSYTSKPFAGKTITVALVGEPRSDAVKKMLPEFEQKTGIKTNVDILPYPTLQEKQAVALTQKTGAYDIVHVDCVWVGQYAGQGWVVPATDFVNRSDPKVLNITDFLPRVLAEQGSWEGVVFGLPFIQAVFGLHIRTDIFKKYSLKVPQTWDELKSTAKFITEKERGNGVYGLTIMGRRGVQLQCTWDNFLWSWGGDWYDKDYRPTINSAAAVESLEFMKSLLPYALPGVLTYDWDENAQAFAQGKAAMNLQWQNAAPTFADPSKSKIVGKFDFELIPGKKQANGSILRTPTFGGWGLMIPVDAKNKEAAWEWIVWATSVAMEKELAKAMPGSRRSSLSDPVMQKQHVEYKNMLKSLEFSKGRPRLTVYSEMADAIEVALSETLTGGKTAKVALDDANRRLEVILRRGGYLK
ncbi:MAG TPA: sugar ABC transporter substrate-binding protein [bacterium]|nr:sugar ABC transporter substrate-binding protein [bacterium]